MRVESLGGTVAAEHCEVARSEVLGRSSGAPGQVFPVTHAPVLPAAATRRP